jgi:hypothetical protein
MKKFGTWIFIFAMIVITAWGTALPASAQEKAKEEGAAKEGPGFTVARLIVGTGVENREPTGVAETFPASTEKIYCYIETTNIAKDTEVSLVWSLGGKEIWKTSLTVNMGPRWRTNAYKTIKGLKGDWKVEMKDAVGNLVKEVKFKVE